MDSAPNPQMTVEQRNKLIEEYLPLVHHVLGRLTIHLPQTLDREDLFEVGVLGLMHAATTYNPLKGAAFKTHAFTAIRGSILDEIRKHDPVPRSRRDRVRMLGDIERRLEAKIGRAPTPEEMAAEAGLTVEQVEEVLVNAHGAGIFSMEEPAGGGGGGDGEDGLRLVDCLRVPSADDPSDQAAMQEMKTRLAHAIQELPARERQVIILYYAEGLRLKEIGAILDITESRVCQIHSGALYRLNRAVLGSEATTRPA